MRRLTSGPGNAQYCSTGARASSKPDVVAISPLSGWPDTDVPASCPLASSTRDQASLRDCHQLVYTRAGEVSAMPSLLASCLAISLPVRILPPGPGQDNSQRASFTERLRPAAAGGRLAVRPVSRSVTWREFEP